eukprot:6492604-Amphidinium_carterae.1
MPCCKRPASNSGATGGRASPITDRKRPALTSPVLPQADWQVLRHAPLQAELARIGRDSQRRPRPGNVLTLGSDCAGLCAAGLALEMLCVPHLHVWATETDPITRSVLVASHPGLCALGGDVARRTSQLHDRNLSMQFPYVDIYTSGFPCQPFSQAGLQAGSQDHRGCVWLDNLSWVHHARPAVVILENVAALTQEKFRPELTAILDVLLSMKNDAGNSEYSVDCCVLDTQQHGLPQSRRRLYIVAIKRALQSIDPSRHSCVCGLERSWREPPCESIFWPKVRPFTFPTALATCKPLTDIIQSKGKPDITLPSSPTALRTFLIELRLSPTLKLELVSPCPRNYEAIIFAAYAAEINPFDTKQLVVADLSASKGRGSHYCVGRSPTLTRARAGEGLVVYL